MDYITPGSARAALEATLANERLSAQARLDRIAFIAALPLRARLRTSTTLTHCG